MRRNRIRVVIVMFIATVFEAFGDIALSKGMRMVGNVTIRNIPDLLHSIVNIYVISGVILLILFLLLYLASLSWADLSYVLPLTAIGYVIVTLLAKFLLHEPVSALRWVGATLVTAGVLLVVRT